MHGKNYVQDAEAAVDRSAGFVQDLYDLGGPFVLIREFPYNIRSSNTPEGGKDEQGPCIAVHHERHYRHFNAAALVDAAKAYEELIDGGGKMMVTLAGAMSTAELGISLAEMIRRDKVQIISCTGANLEEDLMNLVAHSHYKRVPHYRHLSPREEQDAAGPALQPRHRHLHPRGGGLPPAAEAHPTSSGQKAQDERRRGASRTSTCTTCC